MTKEQEEYITKLVKDMGRFGLLYFIGTDENFQPTFQCGETTVPLEEASAFIDKLPK
jgi:hypothetical protein